MAIFCRKQLSSPVRCNEKIKQARDHAGLSLDRLAEKTGIAKKYLENLENANYRLLPPAKAYRLAYLKTIAAVLNLDYKNLAYNFKNENGLDDCDPKKNDADGYSSFQPLSLIARNSAIALLIIFFSGYLIWQVRGIMAPPKLTIYSPLEGFVFSRPAALVEGETDRECRLLVNGQEVNVNEKGKFSTDISLTRGLNTITVSSSKKHGKTTVLTRHVVMNEKTNNVSLK